MTSGPLRFEFRRVDSLPRLAWCACINHDDPVVQVFHGPWVETWADGFYEGAWNGDFHKHDFHQATVCTGTGARMTAVGPVFVTATDRVNCIYSKKKNDRLWVSNSRLFLLVMTEDEYDPAYTYYYTRLLSITNLIPYWDPEKSIPTRDGQIEVLDYGNFRVDTQLCLVREDKPDPGPPESFRDYHDLLLDGARELFANAASSERRIPFKPLSTISSGLDSPAISVIAKQAGCRDTVTFATVNGRETGDSGAGIAKILNMNCFEFEQYAYRQRSGMVEAEFCGDGFTGYHVSYASMEDLLPQRMLINGYRDAVWRSDAMLMSPGVTVNVHSVGGGGMTEFRLRVGFQTFTMAYVGIKHFREIFAISRSKEMAPWRLESDYDQKPIPRRILEQAGVPRGAFAQRKYASGIDWLTRQDAFTTHAWQDFMQYYNELQARVSARDWFWPRLLYKGVCDYELALSKLCRLHPGFKRFSYLRSMKVYKEYQWPWEMRFTMHWGSARIRDRYRPALDQA